jgi:hypothetical protein
MSEMTMFETGNLPAFAKNRELSSLAKSLAGGGSGGGGKRISIKGGVFRLIHEGKQIAAVDERYLDVVVVNAAEKISRTFYAGAWDPENPAPPDCWSADGDKPDASAASPQSPTCATCPQNIKGSGQGESRACRFNQRLAVVLANDLNGDVLQLQLPATSIFGKAEGDNHPLQSYARLLAAQSISPEMVVTRMKFDTQKESPKLFFKPLRWLTDDEHVTAVEKGQSEEAKRAVTMTVAQTWTRLINLSCRCLRVNPQSLRKPSLPRLKKKRLMRLTSLNFARKNPLHPPLRKATSLQLWQTGIPTIK